MLYILKAFKHMFSHLIPVMYEEGSKAVISALHTGEDLRFRDLEGHKVMWLLSAFSTCLD